MTPPAAPTLHPKRCDTCHNERCPVFKNKPPITEKMVRESKIADAVDRQRALIFLDMTGWVGCASHSSTPDAYARQRIEDVVKELEKEKQNACNEISGVFLDQDRYRQGIVCGCNKAITLLKGGVERKDKEG